MLKRNTVNIKIINYCKLKHYLQKFLFDSQFWVELKMTVRISKLGNHNSNAGHCGILSGAAWLDKW